MYIITISSTSTSTARATNNHNEDLPTPSAHPTAPTTLIPPHPQLTWARWPLQCGLAFWGGHRRSLGPWILVHPLTPAPTDLGWGGAGSPGLGQGFLCGTFLPTFLPGLELTFEEAFMSGMQKSESLFVIVITCYTPLWVSWRLLYQIQLWIFYVFTHNSKEKKKKHIYITLKIGKYYWYFLTLKLATI